MSLCRVQHIRCFVRGLAALAPQELHAAAALEPGMAVGFPIENSCIVSHWELTYKGRDGSHALQARRGALSMRRSLLALCPIWSESAFSMPCCRQGLLVAPQY